MAEEVFWRVASLSELQAFARMLYRQCRAGLSIGLCGELGAGKTALVRALLASSVVPNAEIKVQSPTFVLENVYPLVLADQKQVEVRHWDLYRLPAGGEIFPELQECLDESEGLLLVEWPERIAGLESLLDVVLLIEFDGTEGARRIRFLRAPEALLARMADNFRQAPEVA